MVDARTFQALSDPTRLKILTLLGGGSMNVSAMVERLDCTQPAVSRHLKVLREAGLIVDARRGKWIEYSSNPRAVAEAAEYLNALHESGRGAGGGGRGGAKQPGTAGPRPRGRGTVRPAGARAASDPRAGKAAVRKSRRPEIEAPEHRSREAEARGAHAARDRKPDAGAADAGMPGYVVQRDVDFIDDLML
jgi:ArsR family transcriptional regulator